MITTRTYEIGKNGNLDPLVSTFDHLQPGAIVKWGGNMAWGPTRYCIIARHESDFGLSYDGYNLDEPEHNAMLHRIEARSIKDPNDPSLWHSQHFFIEPDTATPAQVEEYKADALRQGKAQKQREADAQTEADHLEAIGRELWPELIGTCAAVIVAELHRDDSDLQSDYFASSTVSRVILAASTHKRDVFSEMRKAAAIFPPTASLATAPDRGDNQYPPDEHREKYSMGAGYYLSSTGSYSGWHVSKDIIGKNGPSRQDYIDLAKCHDHLTKKNQPAKAKVNQITETPAEKFRRLIK